MTRAQHLAAKMHLAIDALEKIALDFPTAGRGIERILALYLTPVRDEIDESARNED